MIDHLCFMTWPFNGRKAGVGLVLIQTLLLLLCKSSCSMKGETFRKVNCILHEIDSDFQRKTSVHYVEHSMTAAFLFYTTTSVIPLPSQQMTLELFHGQRSLPRPQSHPASRSFISLIKSGVQFWNNFIFVLPRNNPL